MGKKHFLCFMPRLYACNSISVKDISISLVLNGFQPTFLLMPNTVIISRDIVISICDSMSKLLNFTHFQQPETKYGSLCNTVVMYEDYIQF